MTVAAKIIPVGENEQVTLTAPQKFALKVDRVDDHTITLSTIAEQDRTALPSETQPGAFPAEVLKFARERDLVAFVEKALQAAQQVFVGAERIALSLKQDEYHESYVDVQVVLNDTPEGEAEQYSVCAEKWAALLPPHAARLIQLSTAWA